MLREMVTEAKNRVSNDAVVLSQLVSSRAYADPGNREAIFDIMHEAMQSVYSMSGSIALLIRLAGNITPSIRTEVTALDTLNNQVKAHCRHIFMNI